MTASGNLLMGGRMDVVLLGLLLHGHLSWIASAAEGTSEQRELLSNAYRATNASHTGEEVDGFRKLFPPHPNPRYESCKSYATHPTEAPFDVILTKDGRALPSLKRSLTRWGWPFGNATKECWQYKGNPEECSRRGMMIRYKIIKKVIYVNSKDYQDLKFSTSHSKQTNVPWVHAILADVLEEMLLVTVWLYKDWPDMDIIVTVASGPGKRPLLYHMPVLTFATIGYSYSIPHQKNWMDWAMSESQLRRYTDCLNRRFPPETKRPVVLFRGSPTGYHRGWDPSTKNNFTLFPELMIGNQRTHAALTSHNHPFMDVKLTRLTKGLFDKLTPELKAEFERVLVGSKVDHEDWSQAAFVLSLNGHGYTDRVPSVLLGSSPALIPNSHMKEWFIGNETGFRGARSLSRFNSTRGEEGDHFFFFEEDHSDLLIKAKRLVAMWNKSQAPFVDMVKRSQALAVAKFNLLSVLDAFAFSITHLWKTWCGWEVVMDEGFELLKVFRPFRNRYIPDAIWDFIAADMHLNMHVAPANKTSRQR